VPRSPRGTRRAVPSRSTAATLRAWARGRAAPLRRRPPSRAVKP